MEIVTLLDRQLPYLPSGNYRMDVSQKFAVGGNSMNITSQQVFFTVESERFFINPQTIDSIYPPAAAIGDFSSTLPHIILKRSTLPWENAVCTRPIIQVGVTALETRNLPCLALIVVADGDAVSVRQFNKTIWENQTVNESFLNAVGNQNEKPELV